MSLSRMHVYVELMDLVYPFLMFLLGSTPHHNDTCQSATGSFSEPSEFNRAFLSAGLSVVKHHPFGRSRRHGDL